MDRLSGFLKTSFTEFFPADHGGQVMSDPGCERDLTCDGNSAAFKGFLSSWMAFAITLVDAKTGDVLPKIKASAAAAAKQCSGGGDGKLCGQRWYQPTWDGSQGIGQQLSALSVISSSLVTEKKAVGPKSTNTGGTSESNPNAGTGHDHGGDHASKLKKITAGDRAGAGIVTAVFLSCWIGVITWMLYER